jgi:hypothetical protein
LELRSLNGVQLVHALLDILEDEAVAMGPKHDAKAGAQVLSSAPNDFG